MSMDPELLPLWVQTRGPGLVAAEQGAQVAATPRAQLLRAVH
jgi:hypothetical protein